MKKYDCITCQVRHCSILDTVDTNTLKAISTFKQNKRIKKGHPLFVEGESIKGVCFIKSGFLKIEITGKNERPLIIGIAEKGTVFGHRVSDEHNFYSNSAIAVTDVQYCYIPYEHFNRITDNCQVLRQQIVRLFLKELDLVKKRAVSLAHKSVREKLAEAILLLAEAFNYEEQRFGFHINLSRQEIADWVGTTKEQVSKNFKDFEKEGLIKCTGKKFTFLDASSLKQIIG